MAVTDHLHSEPAQRDWQGRAAGTERAGLVDLGFLRVKTAEKL